jgi:predicted DNA-binding WGR domain protein
MQSYLEKRDSAKNLARFYSLRVFPNLFGEWSLQREWGRIGQAGQVRRLYFPSQEEAIRAFLKLEAAKRRRGYWLKPEQLELF